MLGPVLGGLLAWIDVGLAMFVDAGTFAVSALCVLLLRPARQHQTGEQRPLPETSQLSLPETSQLSLHGPTSAKASATSAVPPGYSSTCRAASSSRSPSLDR